MKILNNDILKQLYTLLEAEDYGQAKALAVDYLEPVSVGDVVVTEHGIWCVEDVLDDLSIGSRAGDRKCLRLMLEQECDEADRDRFDDVCRKVFNQEHPKLLQYIVDTQVTPFCYFSEENLRLLLGDVLEYSEGVVMKNWDLRPLEFLKLQDVVKSWRPD